MSRFPPRLHVVLARESLDALVFRRGPSRLVAAFHWNRQTDEFRLGQWLRARVYERRADLSPDGQYLIYFAMDGRWDSRTRGAWTAISRAPWLKAVALFAKGDCWHGGGLFTGRQRYWLNDGYGHQPLEDYAGLRRDSGYAPDRYFGGECPGVYYPRLMRDGWRLTSESGARYSRCTIFEKSLPHGGTLRKKAFVGPSKPGRGCYWDEHELLLPGRPAQTHVDWEWADVDRQTLVWAAGGCLYRAAVGRQNLEQVTLLHDFRAYTFERRVAPY
jgi:hypothetical protein